MKGLVSLGGRWTSQEWRGLNLTGHVFGARTREEGLREKKEGKATKNEEFWEY